MEELSLKWLSQFDNSIFRIENTVSNSPLRSPHVRKKFRRSELKYFSKEKAVRGEGRRTGEKVGALWKFNWKISVYFHRHHDGKGNDPRAPARMRMTEQLEKIAQNFTLDHDSTDVPARNVSQK